MKRFIQALVVATAVVGDGTAAQAASPVVQLSGDGSLSAGAARLHVHVGFSTDTPGAELFTVQRFDVTLDGVVRRRGVAHTYIKARSCPRLPMRGVFDFRDWTTGQTASVTVDAKVRCTAR